MGKMSDYGIWLEERGYAEWDDMIDGYVFLNDADPEKAMRNYIKELRLQKEKAQKEKTEEKTEEKTGNK